MIAFRPSIESPSEYQQGPLPAGAVRLDTPASMDATMKKAAPIAVALSLPMPVLLFCKMWRKHAMVVFPPAILGGVLIGLALLIVHEWLHAIVYPREATVTLGKLKGKMVFVALASYPLKRSRFVLMCLLPFLLGLLPLAAFAFSPADATVLNGVLFGMACMGMFSPFPDVYNVIVVMRQARREDALVFVGDDLYRVPQQKSNR